MLFVKNNKAKLIEFSKFIFLGVGKTIVTNICYVICIGVNLNAYISFTISTLLVLGLSFIVNYKLIFFTNKAIKLSSLCIKYITLFLMYSLISYLLIYFLKFSNISIKFYSIIITVFLLYPNYYATRKIFKK